MEPGSLHGLHLCVSDIEAARDELVGRGAEVGEIFHFGEAGQAPGIDPERRSYATFMPFHDPDGNSWLVQEVGATGGSSRSRSRRSSPPDDTLVGLPIRAR